MLGFQSDRPQGNILTTEGLSLSVFLFSSYTQNVSFQTSEKGLAETNL